MPDNVPDLSREANELSCGTIPGESNRRSSEGTQPFDEFATRLDRLGSGAPRPAPPLHDFTGHKLGHYAIEHTLGSGGHGVVYKAHHTEIDREVALKIPRPEVLLDVDRRRRFVKEAQAAARLDHPAIVRIYEAELSGSTPYIASEYCPGSSLAEWMDDTTKRNIGKRGGSRQPVGKEIAVFIEQLAQAVHYAHSRGVIHRDLKPSNVLLARVDTALPSCESLASYQPRLTDFGLALLSDSRSEDTRSGVVIGTPQYMSPEQASDHRTEVGAATDVFSLGAILYHLLTGVPPFAAETYFGTLTRVREGTVTPIAKLCEDVDQDLETICMKCLQRSPSDRYASAADFASDLSLCVSGNSIMARPLRPWQAFARWSRQPIRVGEAMGAMILISAVRVVYAILGLLMMRSAEGMAPTNVEMNELLTAYFFLAAPTEIWLIWAARRKLKRKLRSTFHWTTFVILLVCAITTLLVAMNIMPAPLWYQRAPGARVMVFSIIGVLFVAQATCWYVALWTRVDSPEVASQRRRGKRFAAGLAITGMSAAILFSFAKPTTPPDFAGPSEFRQFDGIDDHVFIDSVGFAESQPFTLETWVRANDSRKSIIVQHGPVSLGTVATPDGNRFRVQIANSSDSIYLLDTAAEFLNEEWAHLAITYDVETVRCFLNGEPQVFDISAYQWTGESDIQTQLQSLPRPLVLKDVWPGSKVFIGSNKNDKISSFFFAGQIGEVRLTRDVFYHGNFTPRPNLSVGPDTEFLFHLNDQADTELPDETRHFIGQMRR